MKKRYVLAVIILVILVGIGITILTQNEKKSRNQDSQNSISDKINISDSINLLNEIKGTVPTSWKTYNDNNIGISFKYPNEWYRYREESNVVNRSGNIVAVEVNFIDSLSNTTLLVSYHLPPNGVELYQYALSQYESSQGWYEKDSKLIEIAGNKAVKAFAEMRISGKGTPLNPPLRLIFIDFLDKNQKGAFQLQFKTPLAGEDIEVTKFEKLLSTFEFTK